jgi:isoleucyl-tRNA synthetase
MQAEDFIFRDEDVRDTHNRVIGILWNTSKFYELYKDAYDGHTRASASAHVLDRWVLARLKETIRAATAGFDTFDTPRATRALRAFIDDYSTWYVRRSRDRMKEEVKDKQFALATQREVLQTLSRLIAPIMPFVAENVYRGAGGEKESVHLESWPEARVGLLERWLRRDEKILKAMAATRTLVSRALEARDKAGIKVRQPLGRLEIRSGFWKLSPALLEVVKEEVNVKEVREAPIAEEIKLDTTLTPELQEEGFARDITRAIQSARKEAGLKPGEEAKVVIDADAAARAIIEKHPEIATATHTTLSFGAVAGAKTKIGGHDIALSLSSHQGGR